MLRVLHEEHIAEIIKTYGGDKIMLLMIDRLKNEFERLASGMIADSPSRFGFTRRGSVPGVVEIMPHREPGDCVAVKIVSYSPKNIESYSIPTVLGYSCLIDDDSGELIAIADARLITSIRTGAASAIATERMCRQGDGIVGIVGAGVQAVTQLHAISHIIDVHNVLVYDINASHAQSFMERTSFVGAKSRLGTPEEIMVCSDVVCTATSVEVGAGPVVPEVSTKPWLHVNAVGSDERGKTELPVGLLRRAKVVPDHVKQALNEGECQQVGKDGVAASLPEICIDDALAAEYSDLVTVFDSTGFALEDKVALELITELASDLNVGVVQHNQMVKDPLNPYSGIWD